MRSLVARFAPVAFALGLWAAPVSAGTLVDLDVSLLIDTDPVFSLLPLPPDALRSIALEQVNGYRLLAGVQGNSDPYLAFRIELTNLSAALAPFSYSFLLPTVPFAVGYELRAVLDTTLIDSNGDGSASWTLAGGGFGIVESSSQIAFLLPPIDHSLDSEDMLTDARMSFVPPTASWDRLHALGFGNLSAGDTIVIEGFVCATPIGTACPARPVLTPEPSAGALAWVAVALLGLSARARRPPS